MFERGSAGLFFAAQLDALNTPASNPGSGIYHVKMDPRTLIEQVGFVDGTSEIYCQQTGRITSVTDVNGNTINTFWSTAPADTLGRLPDVFTDIADTTDSTSGCVNPSSALPTPRAAVSRYFGDCGITHPSEMCM